MANILNRRKKTKRCDCVGLILAIILAGLGGCTATSLPNPDAAAVSDPAAKAQPVSSPQVQEGALKPSREGAEAEPQSAPAAPAQASVLPRAPSQHTPIPEAIEPDLLYALLLSEIALQRGETEYGMEVLGAAIMMTEDVRVAKQMSRYAVQLRQREKAMQATLRWLELDPMDGEAHRTAGVLSILEENPEQAAHYFGNMLGLYEQGSEPRNALTQGLNDILLREDTLETGIYIAEALAHRFKTDPVLWGMAAEAALRLGRYEETEHYLNLAAQTGADPAIVEWLRIQVVWGRGDEAQAQQNYVQLITQYPDNLDLREHYAHFLLNTGQITEAVKQLGELDALDPQSESYLYRAALSLLEQERSDDAFVLFDALYLSGRMLDQARYYLGRIEQYRKNYSQAIEWYSAIEEGDLLIEGEIRSAGLLILNGEYQEGGRRFAQLRNEVPEIAVKAYLTESDFLYHAKQYSQGYALLTQALLEIPDEPSLLYSRGMLAERMDRIELLEQDMRAILQLDPDHAHALNALGYTFVDRNIRLDEAQALIRRALALLPDSPAVIDSMAWFYYRKGEYQKAEALLRRALELEDSPDILAHLIELLWQKGQKEEAIDELERGLERFTDHETLNEQKMRYQP